MVTPEGGCTLRSVSRRGVDGAFGASCADEAADNSDFFEVEIRDETGPLIDESAPWNVATGDGRTRIERRYDKSALVYSNLIGALSEEAAWGSLVELVRHGADPLELAPAARFHGERRRRVIAELLVQGAAGRPRAYFVASESSGIRGASRYSLPFWSKVARGVACIVRRASGRCQCCGAELGEHAGGAGLHRKNYAGPTASTEMVLYCGDCSGERKTDEHAISLVFDHAEHLLRLDLSPPATKPATIQCVEPTPVDLPLAEVRAELERIETAGDWSRAARERWLGLRAQKHRLGS